MKKIKIKKMLIISFMSLIMITLAGYGKKNTGINKDTEVVTDNVFDTSSVDDSFEESSGSEIVDATDFVDGYAWVKTQDGKWYCIDQNGKAQAEIDCTNVKCYSNGYVIIDNCLYCEF